MPTNVETDHPHGGSTPRCSVLNVRTQYLSQPRRSPNHFRTLDAREPTAIRASQSVPWARRPTTKTGAPELAAPWQGPVPPPQLQEQPCRFDAPSPSSPAPACLRGGPGGRFGASAAPAPSRFPPATVEPQPRHRLAADRPGFDRNSRDYDIVEAAVRRRARRPKPDSAGEAFSPTAVVALDGLHARPTRRSGNLASDLTGKRSGSEEDGLRRGRRPRRSTRSRAVLLYHVVPGDHRLPRREGRPTARTWTRRWPEAQGRRPQRRMVLVDSDPDDANAR